MGIYATAFVVIAPLVAGRLFFTRTVRDAVRQVGLARPRLRALLAASLTSLPM